MSAGPRRPANAPQRIVLTGFMGAGKSTVGRLLAGRLGWRFYDTDSLVTAEHRLPVAEIFRQHGEDRFREWEADAVRLALRTSECIVALGGGALETPSVRDLLFPGDAELGTPALVIYLETPLPELLARCAYSSNQGVRPLLSGSEQQIAERLARRLPHYQRAHLTLPTSGLGPPAVVEEVLARIPTLQALAALHCRSHATAIAIKPEPAQ